MYILLNDNNNRKIKVYRWNKAKHFFFSFKLKDILKNTEYNLVREILIALKLLLIYDTESCVELLFYSLYVLIKVKCKNTINWEQSFWKTSFLKILDL